MTISAKLQTINTALGDIKEAIISKGQTPSGNITTYAAAIDNIAGGESIQATNQTGSNVSENDKVWVNSYYYEAGNLNTISFNNNTKPLIAANGKYITNYSALYSLSGVNLGIMVAGVANAINVYDNSDGISYISSSYGTQRIDAGLGWKNTSFISIVGTSEYVLQKTNSYVSEKILKINPSTGEVLKTYNKPSGFPYIYSYANKYTCYLGNNKFLAAYNNSDSGTSSSGGYILTLDDVNNTWTYTSTISPGQMIGITSDYKYVLMYSNKIYDTSTMTDVYSALDFPCNIDSYTYYDPKENICQRHQGILNNATGGNYKIVKYNPETQTWYQISLDYSTIMGGNHYFDRACFENGELVRVFYTPSNDGYKCNWKPTVTQGGYNLVKYGLETTNQTLTGFAAENINTGSTGEVNITLPQKLNVSFTVDANDATIITE